MLVTSYKIFLARKWGKNVNFYLFS